MKKMIAYLFLAALFTSGIASADTFTDAAQLLQPPLLPQDLAIFYPYGCYLSFIPQDQGLLFMVERRQNAPDGGQIVTDEQDIPVSNSTVSIAGMTYENTFQMAKDSEGTWMKATTYRFKKMGFFQADRIVLQQLEIRVAPDRSRIMEIRASTSSKSAKGDDFWVTEKSYICDNS
jgi:hypothetical protein